MMVRSRWTWVGAVASLGAMGCELSASTDESSYVVGEEGETTIYNGTRATVYLPGCTTFYYQLQDDRGSWVEEGANATCEDEPDVRRLRAGESLSSTFSVDRPGTWRLRYEVGFGCEPGEPFGGAQCARRASEYTPPFAVSCGDTCTPDSYRCSDDQAQVCELSEAGCPRWVTVEDCSVSELDCIQDEETAFCGCGVPACELGERRCKGASIEECVSSDGCGEWEVGVDCATVLDSGYCATVESGAYCAIPDDECGPQEKRCSGDVTQACELDDLNVYRWRDGEDCSDEGTTCEGGACGECIFFEHCTPMSVFGAACVFESLMVSCPVSPVTYCHTDQILIECPSGTVCMDYSQSGFDDAFCMTLWDDE